MSAINLELSKRLASYLEDIETYYFYLGDILMIRHKTPNNGKGMGGIKALTLEEAIEFIGKNMCHISLMYPNAGEWTFSTVDLGVDFKGTLMECYEQFLEYLLENNLL